jgi:hypothetical protein
MPAKFQQVVLYQWKPNVTPERVAWHMTEFRGLVGKVDGLLHVQGGHKSHCYGFGPAAAIQYDDILILTWTSAAVFATWGKHPEHDRLAPGLIADLTNLVCFTYEDPSL